MSYRGQKIAMIVVDTGSKSCKKVVHEVKSHTTLSFFDIFLFACISGWIFQKVLPEMVQKGLILSQKGLISNRCNFGLFAPKSMRFPSKDRKSKDLSF